MTMGERVRRGVVVLGLLVAGSAGCAAGQPEGERVSHAAPPASRSAVAGATTPPPAGPTRTTEVVDFPVGSWRRLPSSPPVRVEIPAIGVSSPLVRLGLNADGTMQVPGDFQVAGWFTGGAQPGQLGPAVIAGHVDSRTGPAVFYRLRDLRPGDEIRVVRADRRVVRFRVESLASYPKQSLPDDAGLRGHHRPGAAPHHLRRHLRPVQQQLPRQPGRLGHQGGRRRQGGRPGERPPRLGGRLPGGRTASTTEPPASRPEPGPDRPVRSNGPERPPLPGPGPRARPPVPDPEGPALRVVLVSRDNMLAGALRSLIETPGGVRVLDWYSEELDSAIRHADVVIVDMPPNLHERTFAVIDGRFLGRTVVLLQEGEHAEALPAGPSRAVLFRPLQIGELWSAITGATTPVPAEPPLRGVEAGSPARGLEEPEPEAEEAAGDRRRRTRSKGRRPPRRWRWPARGCRSPSRGG